MLKLEVLLERSEFRPSHIRSKRTYSPWGALPPPLSEKKTRNLSVEVDTQNDLSEFRPFHMSSKTTYTFFIGNSIFHLTVELLTNFFFGGGAYAHHQKNLEIFPLEFIPGTIIEIYFTKSMSTTLCQNGKTCFSEFLPFHMGSKSTYSPWGT